MKYFNPFGQIGLSQNETQNYSKSYNSSYS